MLPLFKIPQFLLITCSATTFWKSIKDTSHEFELVLLEVTFSLSVLFSLNLLLLFCPDKISEAKLVFDQSKDSRHNQISKDLFKDSALNDFVILPTNFDGNPSRNVYTMYILCIMYNTKCIYYV